MDEDEIDNTVDDMVEEWTDEELVAIVVELYFKLEPQQRLEIKRQIS